MEKNFRVWNIFKEKLNNRKREIYFRKGEIWWCALGVNIGYEQDGKNRNFERPILVLRKISRHLALILPLSSKIKNHPYYQKYKHEGKFFSAIIFQMRVASTKRFLRRLGTLEKSSFTEILDAVVKFVQDK